MDERQRETMLKLLLKAIDEDDLEQASSLLRRDPGLALSRVAQPKLYRDRILHWLYAGDTPLHLAAAGHRVKIVEQLLAAGANPNAAENHRHSSPLHYAADGVVNGNSAWEPQHQVRTIQLLLEGGADINAQDKNGATPLHRAVRTRCAEAVQLLLKAGADPVLRNKPGSTAFHLAVQNTGRGGSGSTEAIEAQKKIIQIFLNSGVTPNVTAASGKSVRDSAQSEWIQELLAG